MLSMPGTGQQGTGQPGTGHPRPPLDPPPHLTHRGRPDRRAAVARVARARERLRGSMVSLAVESIPPVVMALWIAWQNGAAVARGGDRTRGPGARRRAGALRHGDARRWRPSRRPRRPARAAADCPRSLRRGPARPARTRPRPLLQCRPAGWARAACGAARRTFRRTNWFGAPMACAGVVSCRPPVPCAHAGAVDPGARSSSARSPAGESGAPGRWQGRTAWRWSA